MASTVHGAGKRRGGARIIKKDYDGAIADFDQAIRLDPEFAWAFNNRGDAYRVKGDPDRAITNYNEAIRLDPESAEPTCPGRNAARHD